MKNNYCDISTSCEIVKQLKAENEELKEKVKKYGEINEQETKDYAELKAENEKYSLFIEKLCDYAGLECDSEEQAMRTLSDLASQINKARLIIDRYKQALQKIKEIA